MDEYRINYKEKYSVISNDELDETIREIYRSQHKMGEVMLMDHMRSKGTNVQRNYVYEKQFTELTQKVLKKGKQKP